MKTFSVLTLGAVVCCGLMAGLFFAFSVCVMKALGACPPQEGMAAMQSINIVILNPVFLIVFMGATLLSLWALVYGLTHWKTPGALYLLLGSVFYLGGAMLVTIIFNVPMNDALAAAKPESAAGQHLWANYLANWTLWNHVRTVASLIATAAFALALAQGQQSP